MADARNGFLNYFLIVLRTPSCCGLSVSELRSEPRAHWSHVRSVISTQISNLYSFQRTTPLMTTEHLYHLFSRFWADTDGWKEIDYSVRQFFFIFACTNSCVNPLIYGAFTDRNTGLFVSKERLCFMPRARKRRWRVSNWIGKVVSVWTLCISHWEIWRFVSSWDLPAKNWISIWSTFHNSFDHFWNNSIIQIGSFFSVA